MRGRIRRLERLAHGEQIEIPQADGSVMHFPPAAVKEAFINLMARMGAGEDAPPEHPLLVAARNSSDPKWADSFFSADSIAGGEWTDPPEDLSENAEDPV